MTIILSSHLFSTMKITAQFYILIKYNMITYILFCLIWSVDDDFRLK